MKNIKMNAYIHLLNLCLLLCGLFIPLQAAGPITQAILTDKFLKVNPQYKGEDQESFRAGSLFPDIFYLSSEISRENTYYENLTIDDVLSEPSPFFAGMKFHSFIESLRTNYIIENSYDDIFSNTDIDHWDTYLKFLEDQIAFPSLEKGPWKACVKITLPEECAWGIEESALARWHYLLDLSFTHQPSTLIFFANIKGNGLLNVPAKEVSLWNKTFDGMSKSKDVSAYVKGLFGMFAACDFQGSSDY